MTAGKEEGSAGARGAGVVGNRSWEADREGQGELACLREAQKG